jgi:putative ABC transport system permease protein
MPLLPRLASLWRTLFSGSHLDRELDEELRGYLEELIERKRAAGMDAAEARRAALIEMGGLQQVTEEVRSRRIGSGIESAWRDVRHAFRMIGRMPGLTSVVIVSLGVGIGVNTAIFSWLQAVVFQPIPGVRDASAFQLVEPRAETGSYPGTSWLEYRDLRERLRSLGDLLAFRMVPFSVGEAGQAERSYGLLVSDNYFPALGLRPALGRLLQPGDAAHPGGEPVVVVSHLFWQSRLSGRTDAVGQALRVNDRDLTVVGVAPAGFQGTILGLNFDLWVPATLAPALLAGSRELEDRSQRGYSVMGRLEPGASPARVQAEVDLAMRDLAQLYPETNAALQGEVMPFWRAPRGPQRFLARALWILQGVMLLVLLAVCGNTANLVLARASARHREIGVRLALGAGPRRVVALLLTENVVLAVLGAALGAAIAVWGTEALRAVPITGAVPIRFQTRVDAAGLGFAMLLGIGCGLVFGLAPALQLARVDPQQALHSGSRPTARSGIQAALMGVEVGLATVVLIVAGLFFRSFREGRESDPGFRRDGVLLVAYDLSGRNLDDAASRAFAARLLQRLRALPSVESAAIARSVPLDIHGMPLRPFTLEGRVRTAGAAAPVGQPILDFHRAPLSEAAPDQALVNTVTPDYFRTMGIAIRAGNDFTDLNDATTAPQAIVNEEFVRRYLGGAEALGRRLEVRGRRCLIAGVVANSLYDSFGEPTSPIIYLSYRDRPSVGGEIHLRTRAGAEMLLAPEVQRVVRELDPTLPVYDVRTLGDHVEKNLVFRRIPARMFVVLGPALLLLAAIGIYAVVGYAVARRTTEIGVRLALGAVARRVVAQIVGESLRVIGLGALMGWLIVFLVLIHIAPGRPRDLPVRLGVPFVLMLVAAIACWLPARRASRVDPVVALRHE